MRGACLPFGLCSALDCGADGHFTPCMTHMRHLTWPAPCLRPVLCCTGGIVTFTGPSDSGAQQPSRGGAAGHVGVQKRRAIKGIRARAASGKRDYLSIVLSRKFARATGTPRGAANHGIFAGAHARTHAHVHAPAAGQRRWPRSQPRVMPARCSCSCHPSLIALHYMRAFFSLVALQCMRGLRKGWGGGQPSL